MQAIACANHSLQSCFSQKEILIFFCHLNMDFILHSLLPRRSLLPRCPHKVWETVGKRMPSKYCQNTSDFSTKKTPGHIIFTSFNVFVLQKPLPDGMEMSRDNGKF